MSEARAKQLRLGLRSAAALVLVSSAQVIAGASGCGGSPKVSSDVGHDGGPPTDSGGENDAPSGGVCGSTPTRLVDFVPDVPPHSEVQMPGIVVGGTSIYFVLNWFPSSGGAGGYLMRVPTRGGSAVRMASIPGGGSLGVDGLAVSPSSLVLVQAAKSASGPGAIVSVSRDGGGPLTTLTPTSGTADDLVVDDRNAYFVDDAGTKSVPLAGGHARLISSLTPNSLLVVGSTLYLADARQGILSMQTSGGPLTVVAANQPGAMLPVACGPDLCWLDEVSFGDAKLMKLAPGGAATILAESGDIGEPHAIVFDGASFFVTAGAGGVVLARIPSGGGAVSAVQANAGMTGVALDQNCLYWSDLAGIWSLARSVADGAAAGAE